MIIRILAGALFLALMLACGGCTTIATSHTGPVPEGAAATGEDAGIRVEHVRRVSGGLFLDMRYRIVDPERARKVMTKTARILIKDQATGTILTVPNMPKVGQLRQLPAQGDEGRIFWMLFGNPNGLVRGGGRVSVMINEITIRDIVVE